MSKHTNIIDAADLAACIDEVLLFDVRAKLGEPEWGYQAYLEGHLPGARYLNLDRDLAAPPGIDGRHPLPDRDEWVACLQRFGLNQGQQVVCYDDAGGPYAARAWWMLRWAGHDAVAVLDGGMAQWQGALETGPAPQPAAGSFAAAPSLTRTIDTEQMLSLLGSDTALLDARAEPRWAGRQEPIDAVGGHIPGALCVPFNDNLDADGRFRPPAELAARFPEGEIVCYCGSGVTAAHNILAMNIAGLPEPGLYVSSWSGWITDPERPIETAP